MSKAFVSRGIRQDASSDERRDRLVKARILRRGEAGATEILERPPLTLTTSILAALEEERADRP